MNQFQRDAGPWVSSVATGLALLPFAGFLVIVTLGGRWAAPEGRESLVDLALLTGGSLALLLGGALALFFLCVAESYRGHPPGIESHWGGFGGGLGGWRMSASLVFLLGALILGGLFATLASAVAGSDALKTLLGLPTEASAIEAIDEVPAETTRRDDGQAGEVSAPEASATEGTATP